MLDIIQYHVGINKNHKALVLFSIFVGCSKVLSNIVSIIGCHRGSKKHFDNLVPIDDFLGLHCLVSDSP